ncbi:hypothetical protein [Vagococcus silagei]|uniref:Uncharacterized protein n=1 Tax=Vagococcus silagei TaxID=2508885 RepID=A0A4S3B7L8_9ENTE|nr:hypothetical protein [Vagococcus silagei]THB61656.1 hypothetical protein ESZ54_04185 [Vagococcus silagei]
MFPKLKVNPHLKLFRLIGVNGDKYTTKLSDFYEEKKRIYLLSLMICLPPIIVLSGFFYFILRDQFHILLIVLTSLFILGFFIIALPAYLTSQRETAKMEKELFHDIETHLTELANQDFFSKDAKAKRLLNQEFQIAKLQPVKQEHIQQILQNEKLSYTTLYYRHLKTKEIVKKQVVFYEKQPLKPIVLATIFLQDDSKRFLIQVQIPVEFELVNGLVSEQIVYLDKSDYIVNPKILIDQYHFRKLYQSK